MAIKVKNELYILTTNIFSVKYKGQDKELDFADKCKIVAAFVFGFLPAGIGSPIAGFATSYCLRSRKIEQLKLSDSDFVNLALDTLDALKNPAPEISNEIAGNDFENVSNND